MVLSVTLCEGGCSGERSPSRLRACDSWSRGTRSLPRRMDDLFWGTRWRAAASISRTINCASSRAAVHALAARPNPPHGQVERAWFRRVFDGHGAPMVWSDRAMDFQAAFDRVKEVGEGGTRAASSGTRSRWTWPGISPGGRTRSPCGWSWSTRCSNTAATMGTRTSCARALTGPSAPEASFRTAWRHGPAFMGSARRRLLLIVIGWPGLAVRGQPDTECLQQRLYRFHCLLKARARRRGSRGRAVPMA